jgi:phage terminase small subunit
MTKSQDLGGTQLRNAADARKRAFAEHVAAGKNGTEAARLAGFSGTDASLGATASRLLKTDKVRELIDQAVTKASTKRILTATERRELLTSFAEASEVPVDIRDRIAAVKELNAMDGLHVKRLEHSGPDGKPINTVLAAIPEDEIRKRLAELAGRKKP